MVLRTDYWAPDLSREELAASIANWCDALEDWPLDQIREALTEHRDKRPDKRPNPGHISGIMKEKRGMEFARRMPRDANRSAEPAQTMTPEQRTAHVAELAEKLPNLRGVLKPIPQVVE